VLKEKCAPEATVDVNGRPYRVYRQANGYEWRFVSVDKPREGFTMNFEQMVKAGFERLTGYSQ